MHFLFKKTALCIITLIFVFNVCFIVQAQDLSLQSALPDQDTTTSKFMTSLGYAPITDTIKAITRGAAGSATGYGMTALIFALIAQILIFVSPVFALLMLYGGYLWMTAAGNEEQVGKAKKYIINSIIGIIIVLGANIIGGFISSSIFSAYEKSEIETTTDTEGSGESYSVPAKLIEEQITAMEERTQAAECETPATNDWLDYAFLPLSWLSYGLCRAESGLYSLLDKIP